MSKTTSSSKTSVMSRSKAGTSASKPSRIQSAATKPVKTTLSNIRRAVRKSFEEHPAALDV